MWFKQQPHFSPTIFGIWCCKVQHASACQCFRLFSQHQEVNMLHRQRWQFSGCSCKTSTQAGFPHALETHTQPLQITNTQLPTNQPINHSYTCYFSSPGVFGGKREWGGAHSLASILWEFLHLQIIPWWRQVKTVATKERQDIDLIFVRGFICCHSPCFMSVSGLGHGRKVFCVACLLDSDVFTWLPSCVSIPWYCYVSGDANCNSRRTDKQNQQAPILLDNKQRDCFTTIQLVSSLPCSLYSLIHLTCILIVEICGNDVVMSGMQNVSYREMSDKSFKTGTANVPVSCVTIFRKSRIVLLCMLLNQNDSVYARTRTCVWRDGYIASLDGF